MRSAVCNLSDNVVINLIMADPSVDIAPDNCYLIEILDGVICDIGWIWDGTQFINPNPVVEVLPVTEVTTDGT